MLELVLECPLCPDARQLWRWGSYRRWIPVGSSSQRGVIFRKCCPACKVTFSLIPDFVIPRRGYSPWLIGRWLVLALQGQPVRSRQFFTEIGQANPNPGESWSDFLEAQRTFPGYQLLADWLRQFSRRAREAVPLLMTACILVGVDLRTKVAEPLARWTRVPESAFPLALALAMFVALRGRDEPLEQAMDDLVVFLCDQQHKMRRAVGRRGRYPPNRVRCDPSS